MVMTEADGVTVKMIEWWCDDVTGDGDKVTKWQSDGASGMSEMSVEGLGGMEMRFGWDLMA